jgi:hypothetical protein
MTEEIKKIIIENHYTHSIPSGKSHYFKFEDAVIIFSIPANMNINRFLGCENVWELSRLWAPDGHRKNLLTQAISWAVTQLRLVEPTVDALVSYADPNRGHEGFVYRAASWVYLGQCEESRVYRRLSDGRLFPRRSFHSGSRGLKKNEIENLGYQQLKLPGKHRFVKGLSKKTRNIFRNRVNSLDRRLL